MSWLFLPDEVTCRLPAFGGGTSPMLFALLAGPVLGVAATRMSAERPEADPGRRRAVPARTAGRAAP